jgi:hypothetical protein
MTEPLHRHLKISRRNILVRGVACVAGAGALVGAASEARAAKMPQTSPVVAYQSSPKGAQQCDNCIQFRAPASCEVVDGAISPTAWCKLWAKKG